MVSSNDKIFKRNLVMLAIAVFLFAVSGILLFFYFKSSQEKSSLSLDKLLDDLQGKSGEIVTNLNNPQEMANYGLNKNDKFYLDLSILDKWQFIILKKYINPGIIKQKEILVEDKIIPPPLEDIIIDDPGTGGRLNLFWKRVESSNIDKIKIFRFEKEDAIGELIADLGKNEMNFIDKGLNNNKAYYYLFKTISKSGQSSSDIKKYVGVPSNIIPPSNVTDVKLVQGNDGVEISWVNPNDEDLSSIYIYKSDKQELLGELASTVPVSSGTKNSWIDKNIKVYKEYYYILIAVDSAGNESSDSIIRFGNKNLFGGS